MANCRRHVGYSMVVDRTVTDATARSVKPSWNPEYAEGRQNISQLGLPLPPEVGSISMSLFTGLGRPTCELRLGIGLSFSTRSRGFPVAVNSLTNQATH